MTPIQQMLLGVGAKKKTYLDDIFSTYLYKGNASTRSITNGINLSGGGGLVWTKSRSSTQVQGLIDTVRGVQKVIAVNDDWAEYTEATSITAFNNNGYTMGSETHWNSNTLDFASWTFRKAPGFFDIVTWTGNGSARTISHSLGCIPGVIIVKRLDSADRFQMYHHSLGIDKRLYMNLDWAASSSSSAWWNATLPTASVFSIGTDSGVNENNGEYIAYLFAGGESTAATACSVNFNAGSDYLTTQSGTYNFGTGDFTIEFWTKLDTDIGTNATATPGFFQLGTSAALQDDFKFMVVRARNDSGGRWQMLIKGTSTTNPGTYSAPDGDYPHPGQWYHVALVRHSSKTSLYINGTRKIGPIDDTTDYNFDDMIIGSYYSNNYGLDGQISNFRIVKGSAVYTSSFKPPTAPLTSITNTILLCCQSSTITAATTIPGTQTISSNGSPSANTSHPFDDPAGFVFGENEDQGVIKCGSYIGNGSATGPEVDLGWEPQWLLIRRVSAAQDWMIFDNMRGVVTNGGDGDLRPNSTVAEGDGTYDWLDLTSTGFKLTCNSNHVNGDDDDYIYMAIRRPDGYVGKPADAGTNVFAMDTGAGNSTMPNFDSGFPVDFQFALDPSLSNEPRYVGWRLTQGKNLYLNTADAESSASDYQYDSNVGWNNGSWGSGVQSWMWKRHAGFDCITYKGNGTAGHQIPHSLSKTPEMIWVKKRNSSRNWGIYHKGLNGGTNPEQYALEFWEYAEYDSSQWNDTAPTTTHFSLGTSQTVNQNGDTYIAMLFASVDGISKVGSYSGSDSEQTITTGFQPRFVIIRNTDAQQWAMLDTTRGWASGNDPVLYLNSNGAQGTSENFGAPTSNGFTVTGTSANSGGSGTHCIYYAHA
tara:strand:- start:43 stop:2658 length:2616 start_codon:yes stop_codon:yes gene_type:complete